MWRVGAVALERMRERARERVLARRLCGHLCGRARPTCDAARAGDTAAMQHARARAPGVLGLFSQTQTRDTCRGARPSKMNQINDNEINHKHTRYMLREHRQNQPRTAATHSPGISHWSPGTHDPGSRQSLIIAAPARAVMRQRDGRAGGALWGPARARTRDAAALEVQERLKVHDHRALEAEPAHVRGAAGVPAPNTTTRASLALGDTLQEVRYVAHPHGHQAVLACDPRR